MTRPTGSVRRMVGLWRPVPRSISVCVWLLGGIAQLGCDAPGVGLARRGLGGSLSALGLVAPRMKANRVLYERAGLRRKPGSVGEADREVATDGYENR
jgi:hypothetical protein